MSSAVLKSVEYQGDTAANIQTIFQICEKIENNQRLKQILYPND